MSVDTVFDGFYNGPFLDVVPAITRGLKAFHLIGKDGASSIRNFAPPATTVGDAAIVGSPIYDPSYAILKGLTNYLQTAMAPSADVTMAFAFQTDEAISGSTIQLGIIGNYQSSPVAGVGVVFLDVSGVKSIRASRAYSNSGAPSPISATMPLLTYAAYHFGIAKFHQGEGHSLRIWDPATGTPSAPAVGNNTTAGVPGAVNQRIGSTGSSYTGSLRLPFAALYDVITTDAEDAEIYAQAKLELAERPTPIVI